MSDTTFRLARLGEDAAIIDFINANFDMRLPLLNRPELYHHYYAGRGGVPQFAVAEQDGEYVSAAGYILANTKRRPDIWVSVWVAAKSHNGVIGLLDTMEDLFVNFIGALTFSIIGYFYVCSRGENKFAKRFIPVANNSTRPKDAPSEAPEKSEIE